MKRQPIVAYIVGVFLGLVAAFAPAGLGLHSSPFAVALLISAAIFGVAGLILGLVWPGGGWRWGAWVVLPGLLLVTLGVLTSGEWESFLGDDLPYIVAGLIAASLGAYVGARIRGPAEA